MTAADPQDTGVGRQLPLDLLSRRVRNARAAVDRCRHGPVVAAELASARHRLVMALQEYASALEARHLPLPYALRTELQLHRDLFDR